MGHPGFRPRVALPGLCRRQGTLPIVAGIVPPGVLIAGTFAVAPGRPRTAT